MNLFIKTIIIFLFIAPYFNYAQDGKFKTNFDIINDLIQISINEIPFPANDDSTRLYLEYESTPEYKILENRVILALSKNHKNLVLEQSMAEISLKYSIEKAISNYTDNFKDGLFGDFLIERETNLRGSYILSRDKSILFTDDININRIDTVKYEDLTSKETSPPPFRQNDIPAEPFLYSLFGPAIALGATAVAVFLFFTIRSK